MCGISGIWNLDGQKVQLDNLKRFTDALESRGPDGAGYELLENETLGLGHRRLSILDLSEGSKQPMYDQNKRYVISYNGEVFNFGEIKKELEKHGVAIKTTGDTEVILKAYITFGIDVFHKFNGMWAIAIYDTVEKELLLIRDRYGIKPLYYKYEKGKQLSFASETISFKNLDGFARDFNNYNAVSFSNDLKVLGLGHTIYKNIYQLLPGHFIRIKKDDDLVQKRWYNILNKQVKPAGKTAQEHSEEFYDLFRNACKLRLISDVKIGTALSGGLDSSAVYSTVYDILQKEPGDRTPANSQKAFVATFDGLESDERRYAEQALAYTKGDALFIENKYSNLVDEVIKNTKRMDSLTNAPITSVSGIYRGMRENGVTVSMDGHGVDEMLYGYRDMLYNLYYYYVKSGNPKLANTMQDIIVPTYLSSDWESVQNNLNKIGKSINHPLFKVKAIAKKIIMPRTLRYLTYEIDRSWKTLGEPYDFSHLSYPDQIVYNETFVSTLPSIFRDFDLASMINSIEIRMPFMDYRIVELLFSLPLTSKIGEGFNKLTLRKAMEGKMSEEIRARTHKVGIGSPIKHWLETDLKEWALDTLNSQNTIRDPFLEPISLLKEFEKSIKQNKLTNKLAYRVWSELNLQLIK